MTAVSLTFAFATAAEAAAFLAGKSPSAAPGASPAAPSVPSQPTAGAGAGAAPASTGITFEQLTSKLKEWATKGDNKTKLPKIAQKYGVKDLGGLKGLPEKWAEIYAYCSK